MQRDMQIDGLKTAGQRPPTCFEDWVSVTNEWRSRQAMKNIPWPEAASGTSSCRVRELPRMWEEGLDECMQITDASAAIPVPKGLGLPLRRRDLDSILPNFDRGGDELGLLSGGIIDAWFRLLVSELNKQIPESAVYIPANSPELITNSPQQVTENCLMVNPGIKIVFFPTVIRDHCILVLAFTGNKVISVYDPRGNKSTLALQKTRPWLRENMAEEGSWEVTWWSCPQQRKELASGVFMLINSLILYWGGEPKGKYGPEDVMFLRRYVAAVICRGKLPNITL